MKTIIDRLIELALSWDELKYCDPIGQYSGWYKLADGSGYCSAKHIKKI